jgi:hypothetical protein
VQKVKDMNRKTLLLVALSALVVAPLQARQVAPIPDAAVQLSAVTQEGLLGSINHATGFLTVSGKGYRFDAKSLVFSDRRNESGAEDSSGKTGLAAIQPGVKVTVRGETRDGVLRATHLIIHD